MTVDDENLIISFDRGLIDDGEDTFYIAPESGKRVSLVIGIKILI